MVNPIKEHRLHQMGEMAHLTDENQRLKTELERLRREVKMLDPARAKQQAEHDRDLQAFAEFMLRGLDGNISDEIGCLRAGGCEHGTYKQCAAALVKAWREEHQN